MAFAYISLSTYYYAVRHRFTFRTIERSVIQRGNLPTQIALMVRAAGFMLHGGNSHRGSHVITEGTRRILRPRRWYDHEPGVVTNLDLWRARLGRPAGR